MSDPVAVESVPSTYVVASRIFAAPRALVFSMWTEAAHFARWFGPRGTIVEVHALEPRPGGRVAFRHRHDNGLVMNIEGAFDEVTPPERLAFTGGFVDERGQACAPPMLAGWPTEVRLTTEVTLHEVAGGTRMTVQQRVTPPAMAGHPVVLGERRQASEGWVEVVERLTEYLADHLADHLASTAAPPPPTGD